MRRLAGVCLLMASLSAIGDQPAVSAQANTADGSAGISSHGLMVELQDFLRQRNIDVNLLGTDEMVRVMIDWYRFAPVRKAESDMLLYRYAGWSEGCATAFKLSLLRQVTQRDATGTTTQRLAGITMMFDPSGKGELLPFTAVSADSKSIEAFLQTVEGSPGFRELAGTTPMGVLIEGGGLR